MAKEQFGRKIPDENLGEKSKLKGVEQRELSTPNKNKLITPQDRKSTVKARQKYPSEMDRKSTKIYKDDWERVREEYKRTDVPMIQIISEAIDMYLKKKH
ncbi:hypothetical protein BHX94_12170 (plasmid) [Macrococcoides bohemicum]|uniref:Uncharacterized protein n=1 Tax=Macrococcoides bohemicum TaxID=1903056 RepID=A0A328A001_9STAP|nr:hypothetical protein [Macrococcus bohemicus]RAK47831.1 hypothetical protein BHX94_12170 [Macrococcus bohemicus]